MSPEPAKKLLSRKEAAAYLRVSLSTFERHVAQSLRCVRFGKLRMYRVDDIEAWVDRQRAA